MLVEYDACHVHAQNHRGVPWGPVPCNGANAPQRTPEEAANEVAAETHVLSRGGLVVGFLSCRVLQSQLVEFYYSKKHVYQIVRPEIHPRLAYPSAPKRPNMDTGPSGRYWHAHRWMPWRAAHLYGMTEARDDRHGAWNDYSCIDTE